MLRHFDYFMLRLALRTNRMQAPAMFLVCTAYVIRNRNTVNTKTITVKKSFKHSSEGNRQCRFIIIPENIQGNNSSLFFKKHGE